MIHALTKTAALPNGWTRYRCDVCCQSFRAKGPASVVDGCPGEVYVPQPLPMSDAVQPPQTTFTEPTDARQPPAGVATQAEQQRRLVICGNCPELNDCLPTVCAKRKAVETGACPKGRWSRPPDYSKPVRDVEDYDAFYAQFRNFVSMAKKWHVCPVEPVEPRPVRLYAIISTWHEQDIIEAAVANCFAEGCDRVYVVDNDSSDDTAHLAVKAGAILARTFRTAAYQDVYRIRLLNEAIKAVTEAEKRPELWWLALDCDEFPRGPSRKTIRQFLETISSECNTVGSFAFDHYPTEPVANVPSRHPADYQPFGWLRQFVAGAFCPAGHWKHSLVKYIDGVFDAAYLRGLHASCAPDTRGMAVEHPHAILLHHVMYRNEPETRARLERLCGGGDSRRSRIDDETLGTEGAFMRYQMLDRVYARDWENVRMSHMQAYADLQEKGCPIKHWRETFKPHEYEPRRWYDYPV